MVFSQFLAFTTYLGWLGAGWWRQPDDSINCTQQEMDDVTSNHFDINIDSLPLDSYRGRTVSGLVRFISYYFQKRELQDSSLKKKIPPGKKTDLMVLPQTNNYCEYSASFLLLFMCE